MMNEEIRSTTNFARFKFQPRNSIGCKTRSILECSPRTIVNKLKLKWRVTLGVLAALVLTVSTLFVLWSGPRPLCHRAIDGAFQQWMLENGRTHVYPNASGIGSNSLAMIERFFGQDIQQYRYVPGLSNEDPKDLVLMYMRTQTHYTWHSDTEHTIFSPRRWMVLSPDILMGGTCPEGGELLDTPEFKRRLQITVAFLREHQRPYWQVVAEEQSDFLKSIKD